MSPAPRAAFPGVAIHESSWVDLPCEIGEGTRIWHFCHVMPHSRIGRDCVLGQNVMIGSGAVLGDRVKLQNNVSVYDGVVLEDGVFCGPSMVFTNVRHPRSEVERKHAFRPTRVRRGATLGANCTVVCGVEVGAWALVGAGAVVVGDVGPYELCAGVPARRIGWACRCGEALPRPAGEGAETVCERCGNRYRLAAGGLEALREVQGEA